MKTLIKNAEIITGEGNALNNGWLLIDGERITALGEGTNFPEADQIIDVEGDLIIPGMIDTHVHFRDPGLTHKGDLESESAAAVAGGVTSVFDMPNCVPATITLDAWADKMNRAASVCHSNYAFYIGATNSNLEEISRADFTQIPGVKLFLGSSTGNLLVDSDESLKRLFKEVKSVISVHAENNARIASNASKVKDEFAGKEVPIRMHPVIRDAQACYESTTYAIQLANETGARLHVLHISTAEEAELLKKCKCESITSETCIQYLTFDDTYYPSLGARIKCNPAIKSESDRMALISAVESGSIDLIGSDHAPHLLSEKQGDALTAPSGMPNIQFQLPLLLDMFDVETVVKVTSTKPAEIFRISERGKLAVGAYADIVRVARKSQTISDNDSLSRCGWTPAAGLTTKHKVITTWVNGSIAYNDGQVTETITSKPLKFNV